jgi:protein-S-isoprenylcysteine O-methyltransferase Ste14
VTTGVNAKPRRLSQPIFIGIPLILLMIILHFVFPIQIILGFPLTLIGLAPIIVGLFINLQGTRTLQRAFKKSGTTDIENPKVLVTEGAFRYSRNPMYLGGLVMRFGLAILLGSLVTFIFPAISFLLLQFLYIPNEEAQLKTIFGKEYLDYKKRVRKWI